MQSSITPRRFTVSFNSTSAFSVPSSDSHAMSGRLAGTNLQGYLAYGDHELSWRERNDLGTGRWMVSQDVV